jgi:hypothetical protein
LGVLIKQSHDVAIKRVIQTRRLSRSTICAAQYCPIFGNRNPRLYN